MEGRAVPEKRHVLENNGKGLGIFCKLMVQRTKRIRFKRTNKRHPNEPSNKLE